MTHYRTVLAKTINVEAYNLLKIVHKKSIATSTGAASNHTTESTP